MWNLIKAYLKLIKYVSLITAEQKILHSSGFFLQYSEKAREISRFLPKRENFHR